VTNRLTDRPDGRIITLCIVVSVAVFILDSFIELGVASGVPYVLVVLISVRSPRRRLPYVVAAVTSILTLLGLYTSPPGGELWKVLSNRALALFAVWVTAVLSVQRGAFQDEKEEAISEVKALSGLFPICTSCKKIRDDKGYWKQIELYVRDHSQADFTHGYCPECADKLRPDLGLWNEKASSGEPDGDAGEEPLSSG
jgi:hypothetical protein